MSKAKPTAVAIDGQDMRIGIVAARFNAEYVNALIEQVQVTLEASGVEPEQIITYRVPGSNEVPFLVGQLSRVGSFDALIALGVIIEGETAHGDIIGHGTEVALQQIAVQGDTPVINGIISARTVAQAKARCFGATGRGQEFAAAALEMAKVLERLEEEYPMLSDGLMEEWDELDELDDLDFFDDEIEDTDPDHEDWRR